MPLLEEKQLNNQEQKNNSLTENAKPESSLAKTIGQCLPFLPLVFEQFTGQKIPAMSGTMAEIHTSIQQLSYQQQQILSNQQQIFSRIESLETNATRSLTSLTQQFNSLRLTQTTERKEIEYNPNLNKQIEE